MSWKLSNLKIYMNILINLQECLLYDKYYINL